MKHKTRGAHAPKDARPFGLLGSSNHIAETGRNVHLKAAVAATQSCGIVILKDELRRYVDGAPVVEHDPETGFVRMVPRPWGWQHKVPDRQFFPPNGNGARKYAAAMLAEIAKAGQAEAERVARNVERRLADRRVRA